MRYSQAAALSRHIIGELRTPIRLEGVWKESEVLAVPSELTELFTEHSARSVVPGLALFVEEDKSKRDMVGRWRPSGADDYARTFRVVVGSIQERIACALKAGEGAGKMSECDILDRAGRFLRERKFANEELIHEVCTNWGTRLEEFSRYLGNTSSIVSPLDELLLPANPVLVPVLSPLVSELANPKILRIHKYLISYSRDRKMARLHLASKGCFWANSELKDCELFNVINPSLYNARCKFCFPLIASTVDPEGDSNSESTGTDSDD